jgi:hypothetical protein
MVLKNGVIHLFVLRTNVTHGVFLTKLQTLLFHRFPDFFIGENRDDVSSELIAVSWLKK